MNYVTYAVVSGLFIRFAGFFSAPLIADALSFTPRTSLCIDSIEFAQPSRAGALAPTGIHNDEFPEVKPDVTHPALASTSLSLVLLS